MAKQNGSVKLNESVVDKPALPSVPASRRERGERLKFARKAANMTVVAFAELAGVTEQTQLAYEKGTRVPDAEYLDNLYFKAAIDIGSLVTGVPAAKRLTGVEGSKVTAEAEQLLSRYLGLPDKMRRLVDEVALVSWLASQDRKAYHQADTKA